MNALQRYRRLPKEVRKLLLPAWLLTGAYRLRIVRRPFRTWCGGIGRSGAETPREELPEEYVLAVKRAVECAAKRTPWESACLVRALTAKKLLNRRGLPCTLYMGVARDDSGAMIAHAWLRCGTVPVTGGDGSGYTVTGFYGDIE